MPDISMCRGEQCPLKNLCYRCMATPSYNQSWAMFESECLFGAGYKNYIKWPYVEPKKKEYWQVVQKDS